ncbi:hypothetical protein COCNU_scaffold001015G000010 [Cocos nucifera]|nr:hypothetical protein [Cocos nucifera]
MDAKAAKMLTKGLFTRKRKRKAQEDGSKRAKVSVSSSEVPASTATTSEVNIDVKIAPTTEVDTTSTGPMPSMPSGPSSEDRALKLPIKKGTGEKRKKKAITKMSYKARLGGPDGNDNERGEDTFDNPKIIWDLVDRFAMPEVVDQMANLDLQQLIWSSLGMILKVTRCSLTSRGHIVRRRRHRRPRRTFKPRFVQI